MPLIPSQFRGRALICSLLLATRAFAADLPTYTPPPTPHLGYLRVFGAGLHGLVDKWIEGYTKKNPGAKFAENYGGSDAAIGSLQHGTADIAIFGRELELNDYLGFWEECGHNPTEITIASGTLTEPGASWAPIIFVNADNPITGLTMKQLDGIFGAPRTGGYHGFSWIPQHRTKDDNLRTWDQLGLQGDFADKEIQTYGYAMGGMNHFMELAVFDGGNKWNENYRQYIENGTKIMGKGDAYAATGVLAMLGELEHDKYGIAWAGYPQWNQVPQLKGIKPLALSFSDKGPFVTATRATLSDRTYPLTRSVFFVINRAPGMPVPPYVKDFIDYVLSAEGQAIVEQHGQYCPLPGDFVAEQRKKLD